MAPAGGVQPPASTPVNCVRKILGVRERGVRFLDVAAVMCEVLGQVPQARHQCAEGSLEAAIDICGQHGDRARSVSPRSYLSGGSDALRGGDVHAPVVESCVWRGAGRRRGGQNLRLARLSLRPW